MANNQNTNQTPFDRIGGLYQQELQRREDKVRERTRESSKAYGGVEHGDHRSRDFEKKYVAQMIEALLKGLPMPEAKADEPYGFQRPGALTAAGTQAGIEDIAELMQHPIALLKVGEVLHNFDIVSGPNYNRLKVAVKELALRLNSAPDITTTPSAGQQSQPDEAISGAAAKATEKANQKLGKEE